MMPSLGELLGRSAPPRRAARRAGPRPRRSRARSAPAARSRRRRESATVVTTIRTPSSERRLRSRSATSWTSPTPSPSTNVTPASIRSTIRATPSGQLDDGPVLRDHDRGAGMPASRASCACAASMRYSPWIGITRRGRHEREQRAQLLRAGVARHVHGRDLLVEDLGAEPGEPVDRVVHAQLVARHGLRRDDHRVAALDLDVLVVAVGDPRQRRHRLALAAGAEDQHPPAAAPSPPSARRGCRRGGST